MLDRWTLCRGGRWGTAESWVAREYRCMMMGYLFGVLEKAFRGLKKFGLWRGME